MRFVVLGGQRDNIGDSLLRRPLLRAAQQGGACAVLIGDGAEDFATNIGLRDDDIVYTDRFRWVFALLRSALVRRTSLVMNAGEITLNGAFIRDRFLFLPAMLLIKLRSGAFVQAGLGVRDPKSHVSRIVRRFCRRADMLEWRDHESRDAVGLGGVMPDWAFAEGAEGEQYGARQRENLLKPQVAFSLRGDRPMPDADWVSRVRGTLAELGASAVVVCQVRRDEDRSVWLAQELNAELVAWLPTQNHKEQEARVREVFARSTWIASDRLHAMIMAMTEGAVPIDLVPDPAGKVVRTLSVVGDFPVSGVDAGSRVEGDQLVLRESVGRARGQLEQISARIRSLLVSP